MPLKLVGTLKLLCIGLALKFSSKEQSDKPKVQAALFSLISFRSLAKLFESGHKY